MRRAGEGCGGEESCRRSSISPPFMSKFSALTRGFGFSPGPCDAPFLATSYCTPYLARIPRQHRTAAKDIIRA